MADDILWAGGKLVHSKVVDRVNSKIEKGALKEVNALVVHQTGASTAESSFNSYGAGNNGAHFLIDKDGTIYQTARIDQKCWHVGRIRPRCQDTKSCTPDELKAINALLFKKGESYSVRIGNVHDHETSKAYPDRYPTNEDSIGIEIVGAFDGKTYDTVTREQNESLQWLVNVLEAKLSLTSEDIYAHGKIGYKQASEGSSAQLAH